MDAISGVSKKKKETMHTYIGHFTEFTVAMRGTNDKLKCRMFKKGLRSDCMFRDKIGVEGAYNIIDLLNMD